MQRSSSSVAPTCAPMNSARTDERSPTRQLATGITRVRPGPESAAIAKLKPSYGCSSTASSVTRRPRPVRDDKSRERRDAFDGRPGKRRGRGPRRRVRASRLRQGVSKTTGAQRSKYLFRIARLIQERSRELAVVETLDNGKPIRESRDVDIPLAAAHFFYYAGWADKLDHAGFAPTPSARRGRTDNPLNFPLLMAAWKLAPALAAGNTCVLKPAETTPLSACARRDPPAGRATAGVVNIVTGDGSTVRRWSITPTSTRSPSPVRPK